MKRVIYIYKYIVVLLLCVLMQAVSCVVYGQTRSRVAIKRQLQQITDTLIPSGEQQQTVILKQDSLAVADSIMAANRKKMEEMAAVPLVEPKAISTDSLQQAIAPKKWIPNPTKATWLALVVPGGGQIYNRKYWKLPIFYGGFAGCAYALTWNDKMYKDYMQAYKDMMNIGREAQSIQDLLPPGYNISDSQLTELLRKRKDSYRRFRDISIFAFAAVYLLSVIDAYVDAELSNFDIGPDLSMSVVPSVINNEMQGATKNNIGVQCSFRF